MTGESGGLMIDLESVNNLRANDRLTQKAVQGGIDLASGHRSDQIWVTGDGRRIPIPDMTDDHLKNVLNYIKGRIPSYRYKIALSVLTKGTAVILDLFEASAKDTDTVGLPSDIVVERARELAAMPDELFLSQYVPIYGHLYQEAYKRKLVM